MAKLRPRARIVRTIGDQLISGPEAALIELVKNAFDADSPSVHIKITPPENGVWSEGSGSITVVDAGHGMSAADLLDKWFEPATSDKVSRRSSPEKKRTMLGAKGVGRFATARLGKKLKLKTVSVVLDGAIEVSEILVDWELFEKTKYLDQVDIEVATRLGKADESPGVTLEIFGLRDHWTKKQLELLVRELRRLASPIQTREDEFKIFLDVSSFKKDTYGFDGQAVVAGVYEGVESDEDEDFDPQEIKPFAINKIFHYMVEGEFDREGQFVGCFINQRGDGLRQEIRVSATEPSPEESECGAVSLRLNIYDREGAVSRNKCNSQLIFLSMLITKLGIPASETSLPLGV